MANAPPPSPRSNRPATFKPPGATPADEWFKHPLQRIREEIRQKSSTLELLEMKHAHLDKTLREKSVSLQADLAKLSDLEVKLLRYSSRAEDIFLFKYDSVIASIVKANKLRDAEDEVMEDLYGKHETAAEMFDQVLTLVKDKFETNTKGEVVLKKKKKFVGAFVSEHLKIFESTLNEINSSEISVISKTRRLEDKIVENEKKLEEIDAQIREIDCEGDSLLETQSRLAETIKTLQHEITQNVNACEDEEICSVLDYNSLDKQRKSIEEEVLEMKTRASCQNELIKAEQDKAQELKLCYERACAENNFSRKVLEEEQMKKKDDITREIESLRDRIGSLPANLDESLSQIDNELKNACNWSSGCQDQITRRAEQLKESDERNEALEAARLQLDDKLNAASDQTRRAMEKLKTERDVVERAEGELADLRRKINDINSKLADTDEDGGESELRKLNQALSEKVTALERAEERNTELQNDVEEAKKAQKHFRDQVTPEDLNALSAQLQLLKDENSKLSDMLKVLVKESVAITERMTLIDEKRQALEMDKEELVKRKQERVDEAERQFGEKMREKEKMLVDLEDKLIKLSDDVEQGKQEARNLKMAVKKTRSELDTSFSVGIAIKNIASELFQLVVATNSETSKIKIVQNVTQRPEPRLSPAVHLYESDSSQQWTVNRGKDVRSYQTTKKPTAKPASRPDSPTSTVLSGDENDADKIFQSWKPATAQSHGKPKSTAEPRKPSSSTGSSSQMLAPSKQFKKQATHARKEIFLGDVDKLTAISPEFFTSTPKDEVQFTSHAGNIAKDPFAFDSSSEDNPFNKPLTHVSAPRFFVERNNDNGDSSDNILLATPPRSKKETRKDGKGKRKLLGPIDDLAFASQSDGETEAAVSAVTKLSLKSSLDNAKKRRRLTAKKTKKETNAKKF